MAKHTITHVDRADTHEVPKYLRVGNILARFLYLWTMFGVLTLGLRVILKAFSANPSTRFVTFVYDTSARYLEPFRGIFPPRHVGETGYLDISALFAIIMYVLFLWAVLVLIEHVERSIKQAMERAEIELVVNETKRR